MTRIVPQLPTTASSQWAPVPQADGHRTSDQRDFASLLEKVPTNPGIDLLGPASASVSDPRIAQAVAEVFNAHGFFASASAPSDTPVIAKPDSDDSEASRQLAVQFAVPQSASDPNVSASDDRPGQIQLGSRPVLSTRHEIASRPGSSGFSGQQLSALVLAAGSPTHATAATPASVDDASEKMSAKPASPRQAAAQSTADRLIFQIGTHVVQLTGRMQGLGRDEQEELMARLTALLESYGLSIGEATLNGWPLSDAILRSNH